jgi:hypothetical protein
VYSIESEMEYLLYNNHKQVKVHYPFDQKETIEVDEGIAELLKLMWDMGVRTQYSCQESRPNYMWLNIPYFSAQQWLGMLALNRDSDLNTNQSSLYGRMMGLEDSNNWEYELSVKDFGRKFNSGSAKASSDYDDKPMIDFTLIMWVPITDKGLIMERLKNVRTLIEEEISKD